MPDQQTRLVCRENDPEIWAASDTWGKNHAKQLCRTCPALRACSALAIREPDAWMIYGAMTPDEQRLAHKHHTKQGTLALLPTSTRREIA